MQLRVSPEVTAIISQAYVSGVETSLSELAELLDCAQGGTLLAASAVIERVSALDLELLPGPDNGTFDDVRVLRRAAAPTGRVERVRELMQSGESATVEFKSSLLVSMHHLKQGKGLVELQNLPGEVLKTVCGFLNTDGGELLVGVDDQGNPSGGIARDMELKNWNDDKWQLHFWSLIDGRFADGESIRSYLRTQLVSLDKTHLIFYVQVMPRKARTFVRREKSKAFEFFVRNGPKTDSLDLPAFYSHLQARSD